MFTLAFTELGRFYITAFAAALCTLILIYLGGLQSFIPLANVKPST